MPASAGRPETLMFPNSDRAAVLFFAFHSIYLSCFQEQAFENSSLINHVSLLFLYVKVINTLYI